MSANTEATAGQAAAGTDTAAKHAAEAHAETPAAAQAAAAPPSTAFFAGNPAAVGVPVFVAGSVALALVLINYVPLLGAAIPIIFAATGLGLLLSTAWAAALGQTAVASIFGIFAGFWLSFAAFVLGLTHNWFGVTLPTLMHATALFLITWLVILVLLTLGTLRLPLAFTALFVLIDATLAVFLVATINTDSTLSKVAGGLTFAFAAVGAWIYLGVIDTASGGRGIPLGRPIIR